MNKVEILKNPKRMTTYGWNENVEYWNNKPCVLLFLTPTVYDFNVSAQKNLFLIRSFFPFPKMLVNKIVHIE